MPSSHGGYSPPWTPEEDEVLRSLVADHAYAEIAEIVGRSVKGCESRARALGLSHGFERIYHPPKEKGGRRCHDCGCPTPDYRCPACWAKLRREHDYSQEDDLLN